MTEPREVEGDLWSSRDSESNNGSNLGCGTWRKRLTIYGCYELQSSLVSKSFISVTLHSIEPKTGTLINNINTRRRPVS